MPMLPACAEFMKQLANHLGRIGHGNRIDLRIQRAGNHQPPEAIQRALGLLVPPEPMRPATRRCLFSASGLIIARIARPSASLSARVKACALRKLGALCSGAGSRSGPA